MALESLRNQQASLNSSTKSTATTAVSPLKRIKPAGNRFSKDPQQSQIINPAPIAIPLSPPTQPCRSVKTDFSRIFGKLQNLFLFYSFLLFATVCADGGRFPFFANIIPLPIPLAWYFIGFSIAYQCLSLSIESFVLLNPDWTMAKLSPKARQTYVTAADFGLATTTQFTGLVHATLSSIAAIYFFMEKSSVLEKDHLFASTMASRLHCTHSSALFFTELMDLVQQPHGLSTTYGRVILLHHTLATLGFGSGAWGLGNYYIQTILLAEISSIFLGLRWFLLQFGWADTRLFKVVENCFVGFFVAVRVVFAYAVLTPIFLRDLWPLTDWSSTLSATVTSHITTSPISSSFAPTTANASSTIRALFPLYQGQVSIETVTGIARTAMVMGIAYHSMNAFFLAQIVRMALKSSERSEAATTLTTPTSKFNLVDTTKKIISSMPHE